jgi:uncharacterized protein (DUF433 family)
MAEFNHIISDPSILGGKPCIIATRIWVEFILLVIASGANRDEVVQAYPQLTPEAVEDAVRYAASFLKHEVGFTDTSV